MDKILRKLEAFYKVEKEREIFLNILEFFVAILAGGFIEAWIGEGSRFDNKSITFIFCLIAIFFLFFRIKRQFFLPESTISYIENKLEYDKKVRELSSKETIDTYIDNAIKTLNENTCPLGYNNEHFCDLNLDDGLRKVLINITQNTNHVLDCSSSKFTIVLFLENYPNHNNDYSLTFENKSLILRDDFEIKDEFPSDIIKNQHYSDFKFDLHASGLSAINNKTQIEFEDAQKKLKVIVCPIPAVCENSFIGVIYIIAERFVETPKDLENTLFIFGRILSNWISKYESCVHDRNQAQQNNELISHINCPDCNGNAHTMTINTLPPIKL